MLHVVHGGCRVSPYQVGDPSTPCNTYIMTSCIMPSCVIACKQRSRRTGQPRSTLGVCCFEAGAEDAVQSIYVSSLAPRPRRQRRQHLCAARVPCQGRQIGGMMHGVNTHSWSTSPAQAVCRSSTPAQCPERPAGAHLRTAARLRSWCRGRGRATRPNKRQGLLAPVRAPPCHPLPLAHATPAQAHA